MHACVYARVCECVCDRAVIYNRCNIIMISARIWISIYYVCACMHTSPSYACAFFWSCGV